MTPKKIITISLIVGIILMLAKFVAYFITTSNAILTDALESIANILASVFALYSIYLTAQPKDRNHPYGHGKVEYFSVFLEGILILIAGIFIVFKTIYSIFYPQNISYLLNGSYIIIFTSLANGAFGWYMLLQSQKLNSLTLFAQGKHLLVDAFTSLSLVLGLMLLFFTGFLWIDSLISFVLSFIIIYNGYRLLRKAVGGLMDESDNVMIAEVIAHLNKNRKPEWIDVHNLRTQRYGNALHIDCHVTLPFYFNLTKVHEEISLIDKLISQNSDIATEFFIHADPCLPQCCHYCNITQCKERNQPFKALIDWDINNLTPNLKHFENHGA